MRPLKKRGHNRSGNGRTAPRLECRGHAAPSEHGTDPAHAGKAQLRMSFDEPSPQLQRSPAGMLLARCYHPILHHAQVMPRGLVALDPDMSGLAADAVETAELGHIDPSLGRLPTGSQSRMNFTRSDNASVRFHVPTVSGMSLVNC